VSDMNKVRLAGILSILTAIVLLGASIAMGESRVALIIIFPIVYGEGLLGVAGIILLLVGLFLLFLSIPLGRSREASPEERAQGTKREMGGVVFIGPVPIVFGSGDELLKNKWFVAAMVVLALFIAALMLLLFLR
jgi:uncharacterized protein (TIGR00304 family)